MKPNQEARLRELEGMPNRTSDDNSEMSKLRDLEQRHQELEDLKAQGASQEELQTAEENCRKAEQALNGNASQDMEDSEEETM